MCRKLALAATTLACSAALCAAPGWAATAQPMTTTSATTTAPITAATQGSAQNTPAAAKRRPHATAEQRAEAERQDPLARAAFWANEFSNDPEDVEAGIRLASALRALDRYPEAFATIKQVVAMQPKNTEALLESARVAIAAQRGFYAIGPLQAVQKLSPRDWRAPSLLGIAYDQTDQPAQALTAHREALRLAPHNATVLCNMALFYAEHGDRAQAEILLRQAAAAPDASAQVRQNLALVLGLEGKLTEAEALERQDLPPQAAENNLAYFKAALRSAGASAAQARPAAAAGDARSWSAVAGAEAKAQAGSQDQIVN